MNRFRTVLLSLLLVVLLLGGAVGFLRYMQATRPVVAAKEGVEQSWPVTVATARYGDVQPLLHLYGQIVAGREISLRARVGGEIVGLGPNMAEGGVIGKGGLVLQIDRADYEAVVQEARARLTEARARLAELQASAVAEEAALAEDKRMLALRERNADRARRLQKGGTGSLKASDLAEMDLARQRQAMTIRRKGLEAARARIDQQKARLKQLASALKRAERDLRRTRLTAPAAGFLRDVRAQIGQRVNAGEAVATLIDGSALEVNFYLPEADYGRIVKAGGRLMGRRATVLWRTGEQVRKLQAQVVRIASSIDPTRGGFAFYARLEAPLPEDLRPGGFVEIALPDRRYEAVLDLPDAAFYPDADSRDGGAVYAVADGRLVPRRMRLIGRSGGRVFLQGEAAEGEMILTTRFVEAGAGIRVEVRP